jgi:hypothetical protein
MRPIYRAGGWTTEAGNSVTAGGGIKGGEGIEAANYDYSQD